MKLQQTLFFDGLRLVDENLLEGRLESISVDISSLLTTITQTSVVFKRAVSASALVTRLISSPLTCIIKILMMTAHNSSKMR